MKKTIILLCLYVFLVSCVKGRISPEIKDLMSQADANPQDVQLVRNYVSSALFYEQDLAANKKSKVLIDDVVAKAQKYLETKEFDKYMQLDLARAYFQAASYANGKKDLIEASAGIQYGVEIFNYLEEQHPQDVFIRLYKILNILNLPPIFHDAEVIDHDFELVLTFFDIINGDVSAREAALRDRQMYFDLKNLQEVFSEYKGILLQLIKEGFVYYKDNLSKQEELERVKLFLG